ncbi:MAG: rhamnulokinase, partial [Alistipes sp.]|nr:rhamnulokinase [Alistipes sp.]
CAAHGMTVPAGDAALMRLIFDSLAAKYAEVLHKLQSLAPFRIERLHVIGGGAQNELLNRMTAAACDIPVVAGPAEATALGNIMVQARAAGIVNSLAEMRQYVRSSIETKTYEPTK